MKRQSQKFKIDAGVAIGLIAIAINVITVSVYMYQANIMQKQQHASAWPYVEWLLIFNEEKGLSLVVKNNGVGPAIIKQTSVRLGEKPIALDSLLSELVGTDYFPHLTSPIQNRVLPAGASIKPFEISNIEWAGKVYHALQARSFELKICYESIYGDQWVSSGTKVEETVCGGDQ
jgi:hypothetical protein